MFQPREILRSRSDPRAGVSVMAVLLGLLALWVAAVPALARQGPPCDERAKVVGRLAKTFAENQKSIGITADGNILEVFASRDGSWTVLLTFPDGMACLVEHGEEWQNAPPRPTGRMS